MLTQFFQALSAVLRYYYFVERQNFCVAHELDIETVENSSSSYLHGLTTVSDEAPHIFIVLKSLKEILGNDNFKAVLLSKGSR